MLEILDSAAKSGLISFKAPYILSRDFGTNFATKWMHKDVGLALESAKELGVPLVNGFDGTDVAGKYGFWAGGRRFLLGNPCFGRLGRHQSQKVISHMSNRNMVVRNT